EHPLKSVQLTVKRPPPGRQSPIPALQSPPLQLTPIRDLTPLPHNRSPPPKPPPL
ncbi:30S ribosomal protein S11, partial [Staphylococcus saprophyticus]|uniref:30S ribosomal protein S11 n=1 Tax=Staphylococcus saprophyticus TaxID=29385 RepID=UPI0011A20A71